MKNSTNQKNNANFHTYQPTDNSNIQSIPQEACKPHYLCFSWMESEDSGDCNIFSQQESGQDSVVSLAKNIISQHLSWLEHSIARISSTLLKIAYVQGSLVLFHSQQVYPEESFLQYIHKGRSLIPPPYLTFFQQYLSIHHNLRKVLQWIYDHAQPRISDELILVALRIILAYLPIKNMSPSFEEIQTISSLPFNVANIYTSYPLRVLHFQQLFRCNNSIPTFNQELYLFFQSYIDTILLIMEEFFHNPHFPPSTQFGQQQQEHKYLRQNPTIRNKSNEKL